MANSKILTPEDKMKLRQPIDEYVGKIQKQIDVLRKDGTAKVLEYQNIIDRNQKRSYSYKRRT